MGSEVQKIKKLNFDVASALSVIEKDEDLNEIFTDEVKISYKLLRTLIVEDKLSDETKDLIEQLFDKIILTKEALIDKYLFFAKANGKIIQTLDEEPAEEPAEEKSEKPKPVKVKKEKSLPRRYGKANILKDIERQGGKATNPQLTALAVNDLKNIYVNLNTRLVNDLLTDSPKLTDEDYRNIRATITIVKNKLKTILKK